MKKQMKSSLFSVAVGLSLFGAMLSSSSDEATANAAILTPSLQGPPVSVPVTANVAAETPKIPFTFYLTLLTSFTNGASIDFNAMDSGEKSFVWDKISKWREEQ